MMKRFKKIMSPKISASRFSLSKISIAIVAILPALSVAQIRNKVDERTLPIFMQAEKLSGRTDVILNLDKNAELSRGQTLLRSDYVKYDQLENEVTATGKVWVSRFGDIYQASTIKINLETGVGFANDVSYKFIVNNGQGTASRIDFESNERAVINNCTYSTCEGLNPDWYLKAKTLTIDKGLNEMAGSNTVIYFKGVPILAAPWISFPLSNERQSGVLPPIIGATSTGGAEVVVPYYFNIAPNRDVTLYPKIIARRGFQLGAQARYLGASYTGETKLEILENDWQTKTNRYLFSSQHSQKIDPAWSFSWNLNKASDNDYIKDFSQTISDSAQRLLSREAIVNYRGNFWNAILKTSGYQLLQDNLAPTVKPYDRLPQLLVHAGQADVGGFDWAMDSDFTRFFLRDNDLAGRVRGDRFVLQPQLSYPIIAPGYFITPKVSLNMASYQLDASTVAPGERTNFSRMLPTLSVDSGLVFERDTVFFGETARQTLEPRLFYVYTPYLDQSKYPNFDSAQLSFNAAQLFNENRYLGYDRIDNANQVTAALVSRFIQNDGAERLRFSMGQRFYLATLRDVDSLGTVSRANSSDFLLSASGRITSTLSLDSSLQYNFEQRKLLSDNLSLQWQPGPKQVINAQYHFVSESNVGNNPVPLLRQIRLSGQWPVLKRMYGVARVSYSLPDRKSVDSLVGLEYRQDCWVFRVVGQRYTSSANTFNSAIFLQLELNGLSKLGSNPLDALRKNIPGYQSVNDMTPGNY